MAYFTILPVSHAVPSKSERIGKWWIGKDL